MAEPQLKKVPERGIQSDQIRQIVYIALGAVLAILGILGFITPEQGEPILDSILAVAGALGLGLAAANKPKLPEVGEIDQIVRAQTRKADEEDLVDAPSGSILRNPDKPGLTYTKGADGIWYADDVKNPDAALEEDLIAEGWTDVVKRVTFTV